MDRDRKWLFLPRPKLATAEKCREVNGESSDPRERSHVMQYSLMENIRLRQKRKLLRMLAFIMAEAAVFFAGLALGSYICV